MLLVSFSYEADFQVLLQVLFFSSNIFWHHRLFLYTRLLFSSILDKRSMSQISRIAPFMNDRMVEDLE